MSDSGTSDATGSGGIGGMIRTLLGYGLALVLAIGLIVLGIYYSAKTRSCKTSADCLSGVIGANKCFIPAGNTTGTCKSCGVNADCTIDMPYCAAGVCQAAAAAAGCTTNADCPVYAGSNKCFVATKTCGACAVNSDCAGATPFCANGVCQATAPNGYTCVTNADCPLPGLNKCLNGTCGACAANSDCTVAAPFCVGGTCVATNCTTSANCTSDPTKPYCIAGVCNATCSDTSQCLTSSQTCTSGQCKTPCTSATAASACTGSTPFCGTDGFCTSTNCTADSQCSGLTPVCAKAAGATTGVCTAKMCATDYDCGNKFDASGMGTRCKSGSCTSCTSAADCGTNFSCTNAKCVFDPLNASTGKKWNFYGGAKNTWGLVLRTDPNFQQDASYFIDDLLVKAEASGIDIILVYNYNPATNKGQARFYTYSYTYSVFPYSAPYQYTASSTLVSANGVFVSNIHNIAVPTQQPAAGWAKFAGRNVSTTGWTVAASPAGAPSAVVSAGAASNLATLKAYAASNASIDAFSIKAGAVTWYKSTVGWATAVDATATLYASLVDAAPAGVLNGATFEA